MTRTLAEGLSNTAEMMRYTALAKVMQPGATELETAKGTELVVSAVAPLLGPMIEDMLLLQLRHTLETEAVNASERASGKPLPGARKIAVAFADMVDFTRLGEAVEPEKLEQLAHRLATMARDVAVPPVRFVKTIGDAVMLVCPEPVPLLNAMLQLAGAAEADSGFPRLRVGMAFGEAVSRAGDWFGSPVNRASRVTAAARPGTVLVGRRPGRPSVMPRASNGRTRAAAGSKASRTTPSCTGRGAPLPDPAHGPLPTPWCTRKTLSGSYFRLMSSSRG